MVASLDILGQHVELLPERALFWSEPKILVLADLHLGKASTFRKAGIPIPEGAMLEDLTRLEKLLIQTKATQCIVAGDLFHHRSGMTVHTVQIFEKWLGNLNCSFHLVLGNHDSALKHAAHIHWPLTIHEKSLLLSPFAFQHHPTPIEGYYTWAGHLHPKVTLQTGPHIQSFPCFVLEDRLGLLPAFSSFAGGYRVTKTAQNRIYPIVGKIVVTC